MISMEKCVSDCAVEQSRVTSEWSFRSRISAGESAASVKQSMSLSN
jgi:hypothetical protein